MKRFYVFCAGLLAAGSAAAENLEGVDEMVCAAGLAQICLETGDCYSTTPWELAMPDFVVIDIKKKTISTTKTSRLNRATEFTGVEKSDGVIFLQGIEYGRAFSFVIDEATGRMTVAVSLDGMSVTVFGACTATDF
jgi:hypothetical protein